MPSKYVLRNFEEGGVYHVLNRGTERKEIFLGEDDYKVFFYYLYIYTSPLSDVLQKYPDLPLRLQHKNLSSEIELLAYSFMPNHFHLLLKSYTKTGIPTLMKQLSNAYVEYFNKRYKRIGGLLQGRYKAVPIETDEQLVHVSRYIHLNPFLAGITTNIKNDRWTSYAEYINKKSKGICSKDLVLSLFQSPRAYEMFVVDHIDYAKRLHVIKHLLMED